MTAGTCHGGDDNGSEDHVRFFPSMAGWAGQPCLGPAGTGSSNSMALPNAIPHTIGDGHGNPAAQNHTSATFQDAGTSTEGSDHTEGEQGCCGGYAERDKAPRVAANERCRQQRDACIAKQIKQACQSLKYRMSGWC